MTVVLKIGMRDNSQSSIYGHLFLYLLAGVKARKQMCNRLQGCTEAELKSRTYNCPPQLLSMYLQRGNSRQTAKEGSKAVENM